MSYMHICNLYKKEAQKIFEFRRVYAMEKIHGSSSHIAWNNGQLGFFAGGAQHDSFVKLFDQEQLTAAFNVLGQNEVVVFGEVYGGKMQGMSATYGKQLRFVAFEVNIGDSWLDVPNANDVAGKLGLDFVPWRVVDATVEALNAERDRPSEQAVKCGIVEEKPREGIVIRPLFECRDSRNERVIAKHKGEEFSERIHAPKIAPDKLEVLSKADEIAAEWCTPMRLEHVLDALGITDLAPERTGDVIKGMIADIEREALGEIVESKDARKAIGTMAAKLYRAAQQAKFREAHDA